MLNFAQNYIKFDIFGTFLFKKGVNPKSLVAAIFATKINLLKIRRPDPPLQDSMLLAIHAKRVTVMPKDMALARRIRGADHVIA